MVAPSLISKARKVIAVAFLCVVLSRLEFLSAFGKGTGTNRAKLSPVPVFVLGAQHLKQVQESRRAQTMLHDVARVLCVPGEFARDVGILKSKKKKKRKGKKEKGVWDRCGAWATGLKSVRLSLFLFFFTMAAHDAHGGVDELGHVLRRKRVGAV